MKIPDTRQVELAAAPLVVGERFNIYHRGGGRWSVSFVEVTAGGRRAVCNAGLAGNYEFFIVTDEDTVAVRKGNFTTKDMRWWRVGDDIIERCRATWAKQERERKGE